MIPSLRLSLILIVAAVFLSAAGGTSSAQTAPSGWRVREAPGIRLEYAPQDAALVERLWPALLKDREAVMERLRLFPPELLRVWLAPTAEAFAAQLGSLPEQGTVGLYQLGQGTIVLRSPRTLPGSGVDLRGVLRHELAHGIIDLAIHTPVPLWLHEGLAILVSDEVSYLDDAQLNTVAVLNRLIPLPVLMESFPSRHGARTLAYTQAASFVRFLLRERGMGGLQRLLATMADGAPALSAFEQTYGEPLAALEDRWQKELSGRFSTVTLITTSSILGGLGVPLLLLALGRRYWQRYRIYRRWDAEERLRFGFWGAPVPKPEQRTSTFGEGEGQQPGANGGNGLGWRPPRPGGDEPLN